MDELTKLLRAVDLLYGSVLDEQDFPKALHAVADVARAKGTYYLTVDRHTGMSLRNESVGIDPTAQSEYVNYFCQRDVRIPPALSVPTGQIITEQSVTDEATLKSSEIFGDFLQRHDIPHILAVWSEKTATTLSAIALQRSHRQGAFLRDDEQRFAPLLPHLLRALRIRDLLQATRKTQQAYMDVIHRLPFGMAFLDDACQLMEMSNPAQQLVRAEQGLRYKGGRIRAVHPDDDRRLQRAILQTAAQSNHTLSRSTVSVKRNNGKRPLRVAVVPVRSPHLFMSAVPRCMLVIFDPESSPTPSVTIVKKALQLTEAEALLSCILFTGVSLREAAERLNLSINTCKTQLKSIYAKTGCGSHVDLAKTLFMAGLAHNV